MKSGHGRNENNEELANVLMNQRIKNACDFRAGGDLIAGADLRDLASCFASL